MLRGGFFIAFLIGLQYFSTIEIAALGLLLLISNSFATCISMSFGVECRNHIINQEKIVINNIKYFILTLLLSVFFSNQLYNYLETLQSISIQNYLMNFFLVSVLLYLQQIIYGYELIRENSIINLVVGSAWFFPIVFFFPKDINDFVFYYNLMVFFQIFFVVILLILKRVVLKKGKVELSFIMDYGVYAFFGLPVFMVAQIILEKFANSDVLSKVIVLIQITNLVGFFNTQIITVLYNKLAKINTIEVLNGLVVKYKLFNLVLVFIFSLSYFFRDYIQVYLKQDWWVFISSVAVFCLTSYYWLYNEFLLGKNKANIVKFCNILFGVVFLLLLFIVYAVFKRTDVYSYVVALFVARVLVIYIASSRIKVYFHENTNG